MCISIKWSVKADLAVDNLWHDKRINSIWLSLQTELDGEEKFGDFCIVQCGKLSGLWNIRVT